MGIEYCTTSKFPVKSATMKIVILGAGQVGGTLVENLVFSELVKSINRDYLWFYRTVTGSEIDFLFVNGDHIIPIEVKYGITRQKIVPKVYNTFIKHVGINKAVIVTKDYLHEERRGNLKVLFRPAWSAYNLNAELKNVNL